MNDLPPPVAEPAPVRYLTEAECRQYIGRGILHSLLVLTLVLAFMHLGFGSGQIGGMASPLITLGQSIWVYRKVRRGEKIEARREPPPSTQKVFFVSLVFAVAGMALFGGYLAHKGLLVRLFHPGDPLSFLAAAYLTGFYGFCVWFLGRLFKHEYRRTMAGTASINAAPITVASTTTVQKTATMPAAVPSSRHWWTNTDTRDEIQKIGRS